MIDYEYKNHTKIQIKFEKRVVDLKELPKTTTLTPEQMRAHMKYTVFSPKKSLEKLEENFTKMIKPDDELEKGYKAKS